MSISVPPPEFQFSGLFYNPEWWISTSASTTGGLTQAVANTLYLRKTTTDSASALETFNAGIKSSGYDTITAGATQNMFTTQTANTNLFGNMGSGQTLKLGNQTTAQSVHCSQIDCNGTTINNATAPANGALSIGSLQTGTAGILNIGTNVARTGAINISGVGSTNKLNINRPLTVGYTVLPSDGDIGSRVNLGNASILTTSPTAGTVLSFLTLPSQPIGIFLYEIRYSLSTISIIQTSFNTSSTAHDTNLQVSQNIPTAVVGYFKNIQTIPISIVSDYFLLFSSNVPSTVLAYATVIRTRLG